MRSSIDLSTIWISKITRSLLKLGAGDCPWHGPSINRDKIKTPNLQTPKTTQNVLLKSNNPKPPTPKQSPKSDLEIQRFPFPIKTKKKEEISFPKPNFPHQSIKNFVGRKKKIANEEDLKLPALELGCRIPSFALLPPRTRSRWKISPETWREE